MDRQHLCLAKNFVPGLENFQTGSSIKYQLLNPIEIPYLVYPSYRVWIDPSRKCC